MNWIEQAQQLFETPRPEHFTNFEHCEECAEHDETLRNAEIDSIGMTELGNPGWDPICFCTEIGKKYFMPAFIRLSLETVADDFYFGQFLFHLEYDGKENSFLKSCSDEQRRFIAVFIKFMIESNAEEIDANFYTDDVLRVFELWNEAANDRDK